jgi:hypothetical protein
MSATQQVVEEHDQLSEEGNHYEESSATWESWAAGAAGAFFGAPYLNAGTAHAAWAGILRSLRVRR